MVQAFVPSPRDSSSSLSAIAYATDHVDERHCDVVFLVGTEPDVQRIPAVSAALVDRSPVFRAMFAGGGSRVGAAATTSAAGPPPSSSARLRPGSDVGASADGKSTIVVGDVDGRAFDILLRYLYNETVTIQSVMTALTTLYAAHKYMCPGLARIVVNYLRENLTEKNVLLVLQHICLYCDKAGPNASASSLSARPPAPPPPAPPPDYWEAPITVCPTRGSSAYSVAAAARRRRRTAAEELEPSAPPLIEEVDEEEESPLLYGDDATSSAPSVAVTEDDLREFEAGMAVGSGGRSSKPVNCCAQLLKDCLDLIDQKASAVLKSEDVEDLDVSALKLVVCRETLSVQSESEVFEAVWRWSGRECRRQRRELGRESRRAALEGAQFLVRYLTMASPEELSRCSALLAPEEEAALAAMVSGAEEAFEVPDHLADLLPMMRTPRRGRGKRKREKRLPRLSRSKSKKASASASQEDEVMRAAAATAASDRMKVEELRERSKRKFNLIEEFFVCLACIFD